MQNSTYKNLLNFKLSYNSLGLYFYWKLDKGFGVIKNVNILRFEETRTSYKQIFGFTDNQWPNNSQKDQKTLLSVSFGLYSQNNILKRESEH